MLPLKADGSTVYAPLGVLTCHVLRILFSEDAHQGECVAGPNEQPCTVPR